MATRKFKGFQGHGNEKRNPKPHHLYEIRDKVDDSIYKYGISADPIGECLCVQYIFRLHFFLYLFRQPPC